MAAELFFQLYGLLTRSRRHGFRPRGDAADGPDDSPVDGRKHAQLCRAIDEDKRRKDRHEVDRRPAEVGLNEGGRLPRMEHKDQSLACEHTRAFGWLKTATGLEETVETKDLDTQEFADDMTRMDCKKFNTLPYNILITKLKGETFNIVSSVHDGCGLEAWRLLMKRYELRTPVTKRPLLNTIFNMKAAKKVEEIEKILLKLEDIFTRCETMANNKLPEDIKTVIMMELCTPDPKENLEFNLKDVGYKETREAVMDYVERKRRDPITAMEIGKPGERLLRERW